MFASWGQQAHVETPFTSPIMFINMYANCGNGKIEHTQMIHNFAADGTPSSDVLYVRPFGWQFSHTLDKI